MIENRDRLASTPARDLALSCLEVGIEASAPSRVLTDAVGYADGILEIGEESYDLDGYDEVLVVGGGKASGEQARALERLLGERIDRGLVVTVEPVDLNHVEVRIGDHPVPSDRAVRATSELLDLLAETTDRSLVIALITGGGSALLPAPADGVSLDALQSVTEDLLASGATIDEINAVRKHLSDIKGGGLARAAAPARGIGLLMSDVIGDEPSVIASGPTVPDPTTFADARSVLDRYGIETPSSVAARIDAGMGGSIAETPSPTDDVFDRVSNHLTADGATAIRAAMDQLQPHAYQPVFLSSRIRGEAREAALGHVAIGEEIRVSGHPIPPPAVVLSAGETTVTIRGEGRGGPNQEFALSAAIEGVPGVTVAAIDTDGIDGDSPAAGGIVDATTVEDFDRARDALMDNDAYPYLRERGSAIETGPTGTNVNDFRVMVVDAGDGSMTARD